MVKKERSGFVAKMVRLTLGTNSGINMAMKYATFIRRG